MSHLVLGGTGTVGSELVRILLARGEKVRVVTRSADKAKALPAGATAVVGDLGDPATYRAIFPGAPSIFLLCALTLSELQEGMCAVAEARKAGARRLVYMSVQDVDAGPHIPHFAAKIATEAAVRASGIAWTILRPSSFFQNDARVLEPITKHGVYPDPMGSRGVSRVDIRDIAEAAANALTRPGHENRTYTLAGPEALTGDAIAATWAKALGRDVRYAGGDLDAWGDALRPYLPGWLIYDLQMMYALFQERGLAATQAQVAETRAILGRAPRTYAAYVAETLASRSGTASAT